MSCAIISRNIEGLPFRLSSPILAHLGFHSLFSLFVDMGSAGALPLDLPIDTALPLLNWTKKLYPGLLLVLFVLGFVTYGIINAPEDAGKVQVHPMKGPGGRPLPLRRKSANQVKEAASVKDFSPLAKLIFQILQTAVLLTFLANAALILFQALVDRKLQWWPGESAIVYVVGSTFGWSIVLISLHDCKPAPTSVYLLVWLVSLPLELIIIGCSLQIYTIPHHDPVVGDQQGGQLREKISGWEVIEVTIYCIRILLLIGMSALFLAYKVVTRGHSADSDSCSPEHAPLLNGRPVTDSGQVNGHAYGGVAHGQTESKLPGDAWAKPTETPTVTWYQYLRGFVVLIPYLWPKKSRKLQALATACFLIMIAQRIINLLVPITTGLIVDALSGDDDRGARAPWLYIALYVLFKWLQGSQGSLSAARTIMWIPVEQ